MSKKAQAGFALLTLAVMSLLVIIITESVGGEILQSIKDSQTASTYGYNITDTGLNAFVDLTDWNTTIVAVVAAVIILTFVMLLRGKGAESQ